jgi:hypothetical protein
MTSPFTSEVSLRLAEVVSGSKDIFEASEAVPAEQAVLAALEALDPGGLLVLDFEGVRISSEAARQLLRRAMHRLRGGEITDRYLVLSRLLGGSRYNMEVMLQGEGLVGVERTSEPPGARLLGEIEPALEQTFVVLAARPTASASQIREKLGLNSTQAATNRLAALAKAALARRVTERSLEGGGREFIYAAVH